MHPQPPNLPTLHTTPTWVNRARRPDRTACLALRCSHLWPHLTLQPITTPDPHRLARAAFTLTRPQLVTYARTLRPTTNQGSHRTPKSNAIKHAPARDLFLPTHWSCPLTIEKHQLHPRLAQHFFLCPRCNARSLLLYLPLCSRQEHQDALLAHTHIQLLQSLPTHTPHPRSVSQTNNAPPPHTSQSKTSSGTPDGTTTPTIPAIPNLMRDTINPLLTRYAPLFPPRPLLCRTCLDLRFGDTPALRHPSPNQPPPPAHTQPLQHINNAY